MPDCKNNSFDLRDDQVPRTPGAFFNEYKYFEKSFSGFFKHSPIFVS